MTDTLTIAHLWHPTPLRMTDLETGKMYLAMSFETGEDQGEITYYATTQTITLEEYTTICKFAEPRGLLALIVEVLYQDGTTVQFQTHHTSEPFTLTQYLESAGTGTRIITRPGLN